MDANAHFERGDMEDVGIRWHGAVASHFPPAFRAFLEANGVHADNYSVEDVPRYIRVNPRSALTQEEVERQLPRSEPVGWLPGYYRLPADVKIAACDAYRRGDLYGIDLASGAAVAALGVLPGEAVLDMCCAPGAKLCAPARAPNRSPPSSEVTIDSGEL